MNEAPNFSRLNAIEEKLLLAKLEAARAAIAHAGKKGRALENGVQTLLRLFFLLSTVYQPAS